MSSLQLSQKKLHTTKHKIHQQMNYKIVKTQTLNPSVIYKDLHSVHTTNQKHNNSPPLNPLNSSSYQVRWQVKQRFDSTVSLHVFSEASCFSHGIIIISLTSLNKPTFHTFSHICPRLSCCIPYSLLKSAQKIECQKGDFVIQKDEILTRVTCKHTHLRIFFFSL